MVTSTVRVTVPDGNVQSSWTPAVAVSQSTATSNVLGGASTRWFSSQKPGDGQRDEGEDGATQCV
jgi:hypothetical protein